MAAVVVTRLDFQVDGPFLRLVYHPHGRRLARAGQLFLHLQPPLLLRLETSPFQQQLDEFFTPLAADVRQVEGMISRGFDPHGHDLPPPLFRPWRLPGNRWATGNRAPHASSFVTTPPCTSVSRKSR